MKRKQQIGFFLGLAFSFLLAGTPVYAMDLSVDDAVAQAMIGNSNIKLQEMSLESAKSERERALKDIEDMKDFEFGGVRYVPGLTMNVTSETIILGTAQAEMATTLAGAGLKTAKENVKYGVEASYYGALLAEKSAEVSQSSIQRANKQLENALAREKVGMGSKMDVVSAQANQLQAQADGAQTAADAKMAKMRLCQLLGLDSGTELVLTSKMNFIEQQTPSKTTLYQQGKTSDFATYSAYYTRQMSFLKADEAMAKFPSNTWQHSQAVMDQKAAEINYGEALKKLEVAVSQVIIDLDTSRNKYASLTKSRELAQEAYRLAQLQYENGLCSSYDLLGAETSLKQAELGQLSALYQYTLARTKIHYGIFQ